MTRPGPPLLPDPGLPPGIAPTVAPDVGAHGRRPGRVLLWVATNLLALGVLLVATALALVLWRVEPDPTSGFVRIAAPGPTSVTLDAGETDVWLEYYGPVGPSGGPMTVEIVSQETGERVPVRRRGSTASISNGGRTSERVGTATIPEPGVYRVVTDDTTAGSIGFGSAGIGGFTQFLALFIAVLAGGFICCVGLVLLVISLVLRSMGRRGTPT